MWGLSGSTKEYFESHVCSVEDLKMNGYDAFTVNLSDGTYSKILPWQVISFALCSQTQRQSEVELVVHKQF
jgi:hypothetical protein